MAANYLRTPEIAAAQLDQTPVSQRSLEAEAARWQARADSYK